MGVVIHNNAGKMSGRTRKILLFRTWEPVICEGPVWPNSPVDAQLEESKPKKPLPN